VEQVYVNGAQPGHWTLRVTGFDVQSGFQDFSVVEFPYPDLPDLVVYSDDKIGIPGLNEDLTFTFSTDNIGSVTSGVDFEYVVSLSVDHTSTVQITQANHDTTLGAGFTIDDPPCWCGWTRTKRCWNTTRPTRPSSRRRDSWT
jgi:hypothetical protein